MLKENERHLFRFWQRIRYYMKGKVIVVSKNSKLRLIAGFRNYINRMVSAGDKTATYDCMG